MFLQRLEVTNFRSFEKFVLDDLKQVNVLIGRNNAGKSAVFGALLHLHEILHTGAGGEPLRKLPFGDNKRSMGMELTFQMNQADRSQFIDLISDNPDRRAALLRSELGQKLEFHFVSDVGAPEHLRLKQTRIMAERDGMALIHETDLRPDKRKAGVVPPTHFVTIPNVEKEHGNLASSNLSLNSRKDPFAVELSGAFITGGPLSSMNRVSIWPLAKLGDFLSKSFFYSPHRRSISPQAVNKQNKLEQSGSNLAQLIQTIYNNNRETFDIIEQFISTLVPNIGRLHPLLLDNQQTEIQFRNTNYSIRLNEMGAGIEQLLMVAAVLLGTDNDYPIFIEEPETHIHAGAQRLLLEKLCDANRQIVITTHSPVFLNSGKGVRIFKCNRGARFSTVVAVNDQDSLTDALREIGARNSDVLLSDAVLFVEGSSDEDVFQAWSETINQSLTASNTRVLHTGGSSDVKRTAKVRSELLKEISKATKIPHLFVVDRDERSKTEIEKLEEILTPHVHILQAREIENYLLVPRAIHASLLAKHRHDPEILRKIGASNEKAIEEKMKQAIDGMFNTVFTKRIFQELVSSRTGAIGRDDLFEIEPSTAAHDIEAKILGHIGDRWKASLQKLDVSSLVTRHREALESEWKEEGKRRLIAPGEEILSAVFASFGSTYNKSKDSARIAAEMNSDEIHSEIKGIIDRAVKLSGHSASST